MENFGSEIGQKMRSAVKAKLLELGTGGSAGYIDDELPDYVMIMVANKRSKQQMIADLNLFLGTQTDLFVTWLHEVLQKLQEVTLPAASVTTKKRKNSQKEETATKKDKKSGKKEKLKPSKKQTEDASATTPTEAVEKPTTTTGSSVISVPVINSITDVFAEDLLEKAKKSQDVTTDAAAHVKKGKGTKAVDEAVVAESETTEETTNEFDIPTISEISSTTGGSGCATGSGNREKDLAELAEIQKKIYAAKKHLKQLGEFNDEDVESADEDFLNLKDDGSADEFNDAGGDSLDKPQKSGPPKPKSPIVFDNEEAISNHQSPADDFTKRRPLTPPPLATAAAAVRPDTNNENSEINEDDRRSSHVREAVPSRRSRERERREIPRKRPVHERLGMKLTQSREEPQREAPRERRMRQEKELYVPAFRRKEVGSEKDLDRRDRDKGRERERERERERDRDRSAKPREREPRPRRPSPEPHTNPFAVDRHASLPRRSSDGDRKPAADSERSPSSQQVHRQRIGSRVIVAPAKQIEPSDEDDLNEKPVNSVIKIKPRPPVSPSKQACKNLLLRAVAEAQRSTILAKSKPKEGPAAASKVRTRLGEVVGAGDRHSKLYTKSYRDRLKRTATSSSSADQAVPPSALFRRTTQNLVIEVEAGLKRTTLCKRRRPNSMDPEGAEEMDEEEYVPEPVSDQAESELEYGYVAQAVSQDSGDEQSGEGASDEEHLEAADYAEDEEYEEDLEDKMIRAKTQFVVTMNDEKATKYKKRAHSVSPLPQVSSSSSAKRNNGVEASSTTSHNNKSNRARSRDHKHDVKSRVSLKASSSLSPTTLARLSERESSNSSPYTPPQPRRSELIEIYRKPKDIKKIIIKNDSDDEEMSPKKNTPESRERKRHSGASKEVAIERSTTPPLPPAAPPAKRSAAAVSSEEPKANPVSPSHSPLKRKRTPIKFDLDKGSRDRDNERDDNGLSALKRRSKSDERERERDRERERVREFSPARRGGEERRRITIRTAEPKKYDNIPSLSSVALDSTVMKVVKPKERCKYHPNCTKQFCEFYHPTAPCKSFPNCKFADKCMYSHPHCKYDMACTSADCNFSHSGTRNPSMLVTTAPPLSSHVVPVQNYKSISAAPAAASTAMCKYYPNCQKVGCTFYHPKACRFGKNCINKLECNFYHHEIQSSSKFKWVAGLV